MNISLGPSDEYLHKMREAYALMEDALNRFIEAWNAIQIGYQFDFEGDLLACISEESESRIEYSNPPNLYARETAKRRKYNPQKLRKTDLYLRAKPPIIRRS